MLLTASEIPSIDAALGSWESVEYAAEAFVILGCVGEFVAEFTRLLPNEPADRRNQCSKVSLLLLIAALAIELVALVRTNVLSGQEIARLGAQAASANERASRLEVQAASFRADAERSRAAIASAQTEAAKANERAAKNELEAATLKVEAARLRKTAEDEATARIKVEENVRRQGSRGTLLNKPHMGKDSSIQAYNGQAVSIFLCDDKIGNEEEFATGMALWVELSQVAKWNAAMPMWIECGGSGISIFVNPSASRNTRSAAEALAAATRKSLLSFGQEGPMVAEYRPEWSLIPKPPTQDTIVVLINRHFVQ
jgi:hypothetical protein